MACYHFWLILLAVVLVDGRPRRHHKHKQAHAEKQTSEVAQYYQQATADQPLLDVPGGPQNLNVYNVHVHKHGKDNKVSGHMGPHSVSVSMQGPGMVSLDTSQMNVQPSDQQPDHTISMVKDNGACPECSMVNVKTGLKQPIPLPLTGPSTPVEQPKEAKPGHDELRPKLKVITKHHQKPQKFEEHAPIKHVHEQLEHEPEERPGAETQLEHEPEEKPGAETELEHEPEEKPGAETQLEHEPEEKPGAETQLEHEPEEKPGAETPVVYVHNHVDKKLANKILTNLESTIPVITHKPEHEERVIKGHKLKITGEDQPQRVFGKMDSNNAAVVAQGPGTVSVTSRGTELSQSVIFDPTPVELCPDKQCPQGKSEHEGKGHH